MFLQKVLLGKIWFNQLCNQLHTFKTYLRPHNQAQFWNPPPATAHCPNGAPLLTNAVAFSANGLQGEGPQATGGGLTESMPTRVLQLNDTAVVLQISSHR